MIRPLMTAIFGALAGSSLLMGCIGPVIYGSGNVVSESREVSAFSRIELRGVGEVQVSPSEAPSLSITADDNVLEEVDTWVSGDTLIIGLRHPNVHLEPTVLKLELGMAALEGIELEGSGSIVTNAAMAGDELEVELDGSGDVVVESLAPSVGLRISGSGNIDYFGPTIESGDQAEEGTPATNQGAVSDVEVEVSGSGNVRLKGQADWSRMEVSGSGEIDGLDLETETVEVDISGSGDCRVNASESLSIEISGSGNVYYTGDATVSSNISGSGNIVQY